MSVVIAGVLVAALFPFAVCCFSISAWHTEESNYWSNVAFLVRLDPSLDTKYRPVLDWAKANPPSLLERLRSWESPEVRRSAS